MKRLFASIVFIVLLAIGSSASADMFESTVDFYGGGVYANYNGEPVFDPFYGVVFIKYQAVWDLPTDLSKTYTWSLGYDYDVFAKYKYRGGDWMDYSFSNSGSIPLGDFALGDDPNPVVSAKTFIEGVYPFAYVPGLGGYIHFGDWDEGIVLVGLSQQLGNLKKAIGGFKGELQLIATEAAPVPEPATMLLLGAGLAGLAGARFRKK